LILEGAQAGLSWETILKKNRRAFDNFDAAVVGHGERSSGRLFPAWRASDGGRRKTIRDEASCVCDSCGEEIVVPIDMSAGSSQEYVEDTLRGDDCLYTSTTR
jgi:hypothetical protein